jgi:hypothetical protein
MRLDMEERLAVAAINHLFIVILFSCLFPSLVEHDTVIIGATAAPPAGAVTTTLSRALRYLARFGIAALTIKNQYVDIRIIGKRVTMEDAMP